MLSEGGTIERKNVRSKTLKAYLKAAADIIVEAGYPDPRFSDTHLAHNTEKYLPRIRVILDEQRRWETMEDKKDPVTPEMILWLRHQAQLAAFTSILAATADWAALGLSAGFRICEYGQRSKSVFKEFMQLRDGSSAKLPRAFIFSDFRFLDERSCPLHPSQRHRAAYLTITWRKQKNADNGKEVTFHRAADQRLCPVRAGASIYTRALHLNHRDKIFGVSDAGPLRDKQVESICNLRPGQYMVIPSPRLSNASLPIQFELEHASYCTKQEKQQLLLRNGYAGSQTHLWNIYAIQCA